MSKNEEAAGGLGGRPRNNAVFCIYFRNAENEVKEKSDWERDLRMRGFPERERWHFRFQWIVDRT